jgi:hypothetical protein
MTARSVGFLAFILFSLLSSYVLVDALAGYGWTHTGPVFGALALGLLLRSGARLFYTEC